MPYISIQTSLFPSQLEGDLDHCNGAPGSHLATWIKSGLSERGYACDEVIQEDYGWGFWLKQDDLLIWNCVGLVGGPSEPDDVQQDLTSDAAGGSPEWSISVDHEASIFNPKQFFKRKEGKLLAEKIFAQIKDVLTSNPDIRIVD